MRALTTIPGQKGSGQLLDIPEPPLADGSLLVQTITVGFCRTDLGIFSGTYGRPEPGKDRLIVGHESLGLIIEAPADARFAPGDLVVGITRMPDPLVSNGAANESRAD